METIQLRTNDRHIVIKKLYNNFLLTHPLFICTWQVSQLFVILHLSQQNNPTCGILRVVLEFSYIFLVFPCVMQFFLCDTHFINFLSFLPKPSQLFSLFGAFVLGSKHSSLLRVLFFNIVTHFDILKISYVQCGK